MPDQTLVEGWANREACRRAGSELFRQVRALDGNDDPSIRVIVVAEAVAHAWSSAAWESGISGSEIPAAAGQAIGFIANVIATHFEMDRGHVLDLLRIGADTCPLRGGSISRDEFNKARS